MSGVILWLKLKKSTLYIYIYIFRDFFLRVFAYGYMRGNSPFSYHNVLTVVWFHVFLSNTDNDVD